jgi:uncharacterized OsmC-like protein
VTTRIRESIETAVAYLTENPAEAHYTDSRATAELEDELRVVTSGPAGERITTDMPSAVGGLAEQPSPGWLYRAALAACIASTAGMEAARRGIEIVSLHVEVDGESDDRGILGIDRSVPAGPLVIRVKITAEAENTHDEDLRAALEVGATRCPVYDATMRGVDLDLVISTAG